MQPLLTMQLPVLRDTFYYWSRCLKYGCRWCRTCSTGPATSNTAAGGVVLLIPLHAILLPVWRDSFYRFPSCNTAASAAGLVLLIPLLLIRLSVLRDSFYYWFRCQQLCCLCCRTRLAGRLQFGCRCCRTRPTNFAACNTTAAAASCVTGSTSASIASTAFTASVAKCGRHHTNAASTTAITSIAASSTFALGRIEQGTEARTHRMVN